VSAIQERRVALVIAKVHNMAVKQSRCEKLSRVEAATQQSGAGTPGMDVVEGSIEVDVVY
jgi:hypothetical protein